MALFNNLGGGPGARFAQLGFDVAVEANIHRVQIDCSLDGQEIETPFDLPQHRITTSRELSGEALVNSKKIAGDLGISLRTLTRRLAEHNISFDQLIDDIRRELAMRYIDQGEIKLQDLDFLLGFSSHASFSASFKRWTGKTPTEMRAGS